MNYTNYERDVVEALGVELKNFPGGVVRQPGDLKRPELQALVIALGAPENDRRCHWVILESSEWTARKELNAERIANGEQVYKPRKRRVRKEKTLLSPEEVLNSDED